MISRRGRDIVLYEEKEDFYSNDGLERNPCRVIWRSTSGITSDIRVQELRQDGEWHDVAKGDVVERELFEDCIYFATMSSYNATKEQDEREKQSLPRVKGYNLGP